MIHARITGTGSFAPKKIITNQDLEKLVDTNDAWITERTGIKERRIAEKGQTTSDLAYEAGKKALKAAGIGALDLDDASARRHQPRLQRPQAPGLSDQERDHHPHQGAPR